LYVHFVERHKKKGGKVAAKEEERRKKIEKAVGFSELEEDSRRFS